MTESGIPAELFLSPGYFPARNAAVRLVENPSNKIIPQDTWNIVGKLLLEKISAAGIARVTGISEVRIQRYINRKYASVPKRTEAVLKKSSAS